MHAFGLDVEGAALPGLLPGSAGGGRIVQAALRTAPVTTERAGLTVRRDADDGYVLDGGLHGVQVVSADGRSLAIDAPEGPAWRWQRLLFAQALPLAATLQGVACLHASAVVAGDGAIVLAGGSGSGKSTLAATLVAGGATFLTDDVVALTVADGPVVAHPGPAFAGGGPEAARLGTVLGETDKLLVAPAAVAPAAVSVAAVFALDRGDHAEPSAVAAERPLELLLAAAFVNWLEDPRAQLALLDVCGTLAQDVPVHRLLLPRAADPAAVAALLAT